MPEPTLALHLHNMLVKKGYLKKEVGLYATLESLLQDSFFPDGVPIDHLSNAFSARMGQGRNDRASLRHRQAVSRDMTEDIHQLLDGNFNRFFREKSALMMYYDANWVPEQIPDSAVRIPSMLCMLRLISTERMIDPTTSEMRLKETELIKRAKARGKTDADMQEAASIPIQKLMTEDVDFEALSHSITDLKDYKTGPRRDPYNVSSRKKHEALQGRALLDVLRSDIFADACGGAPISSLNYVLITCHIIFLFLTFEDRFREARHPLWVKAYEHPQPQLRRQKRLALVVAAMAEEDQQAMKLFAEGFERVRLGALACIFWEDLREGESGLKPEGDEDEIRTDQCVVM